MSDTKMTREQAIEYIKSILLSYEYARERSLNNRDYRSVWLSAKDIEALKEVISLIDETTKDNLVDAEDCIKREDVVQVLLGIQEAVEDGDGYDYDTWRDKLDELPSVYSSSAILLKKLEKQLSELRANCKENMKKATNYYERNIFCGYISALVTIEWMIGKLKGKENEKGKYYTAEEWIAEGERLFGKDYTKYKFKCPRCGNIATGQEFKDAGQDPNAMYCECIGRHVPGKGCNWAAYGLFDICRVHVDGKPVFEFAEEQ